MIRRILSFFQRLALTFWLGEMLFFIIIFAPRVFRVLERPAAAKLQASLFPAYFAGGVIAGLIFIVLSLALISHRKATPSDRWRYRILVPLALFAWVIFVYSRWWIVPAITELQPAVLTAQVLPEIQARFDSLHALSVQINGAALLALLGTLFLL
jgi:hypothetical protein